MMVVRRVPDAKAWGAVEVAADHRITNILGDGEHMFCGVHVTRPSVMARLPDGEADSLRQGYLPWLRAGERVAAYEHRDGYFAEHSTPERYLAGNVALLRDPGLLRDPPGPLVGVDAAAAIDGAARVVGSCRIEAQAVIEPGAVVGPEVVVGAGARVAAGARLERTVVWPGAVATGTITDAIVTPNGLVGV